MARLVIVDFMSVMLAVALGAAGGAHPSSGTTFPSKAVSSSQCAPQAPRTDCGYFGIQQQECEGRGCCWSPLAARGGVNTGGASTTNGISSGGGGGSRGSNDMPWCFHPNGQPQQQAVYAVQSVEAVDPGGATIRLLLQLRPGTAAQPELGSDFEMLQVEVQQQEAHRLYVRVAPLTTGGPGERWRVPEELLPRPPPPSTPPAAPLYHLHMPAPGDDFSLRVTRRAAPDVPSLSSKTGFHGGAAAAADRQAAQQRSALQHGEEAAGPVGDVKRAVAGLAAAAAAVEEKEKDAEEESLLDVSGGGCLVFKPQFLQLWSRVPREVNLYGMGETTQPEGLMLRRDGASRALWNSDTPAAATGVNLYGSHPVLYGITPGHGGSSFGLFLANSNALEFAAGSDDITFRLTGGILELYLLAGPSPEAVSAQYQQLVGRPALPPRWALGFHQSKYGYGSVDELADVASSYEAARIPLEVVWSDIDYTDRCRMFTTDPQHYPVERLRAFVEGLHASGRRWVPIVDCGITALPGAGYEPYERGLAADVFVRDSSGAPLMGQVWSGPTHWPDFLHPNASTYWGGLLAGMYDKLPYDGLWLDMNEPSNFCTGECRQPQVPRGWAGAEEEEAVADRMAAAAATAAAAAAAAGRPAGPLGISCVLDCTPPSTSDTLAHPPYAVNNGNRRAPLYSNTLPMSAVGYGGVRQYDSHNLYALAESRVTHEALRSILPGSRPFILTRSSWSGIGRYAAHWSGDNTASWDDLRRSAGSLLAASLAGVGLAGADICGFMGATNEQLCARWLSAGAFYTFSRDHSDLGFPRQEPYRFPAAAEAARSSLRSRYALLPYLYTSLYVAHTAGGTVARPLAWEFPADPRVADLSTQWLLGGSLLVAPVLSPDTDYVNTYFPANSTWCRLGDLADCHTGPAQHLIQSPLGTAPPLFLRAGAIIPTQPSRPDALTTAEVAASPLTLTALLSAAAAGSGSAPSDDWVAGGLLYADNGTDPRVGGPAALRAVLAAGANLATGGGWFEYRVELAPQDKQQRLRREQRRWQQGMAVQEEREEGEVEASAADTDVKQLRVAEVAVVGLALPSGAAGFAVELSTTEAPRPAAGTAAPGGGSWALGEGEGRRKISGAQGGGRGGGDRAARAEDARKGEETVPAPAPVPGEQVVFDVGSHTLRVRGLDLAAVRSFRLEWRAQAAPRGPHCRGRGGTPWRRGAAAEGCRRRVQG